MIDIHRFNLAASLLSWSITIVLGWPSLATGTILVTQNPVSGGGQVRWSQLWQDPGPDGNDLNSDAVCWEDFTLSAPATIEYLEWWGNGACELGFRIEFWRQDPNTTAYQPMAVHTYGEGNSPITPEARFIVKPSDLTLTSEPGGLIHYTLKLGIPVALAANDTANPRWFVGIIGLTHQAYITWNWSQGLGGSRRTYQFVRGGDGGGYSFRTLSEGRALVLGDGVPASIPPQLSITRPSADQVQVAWTTNSTGYTLETALTLPAVTWSLLTNRVATVGQQNIVTLNLSEPNRFFRLRKN